MTGTLRKLTFEISSACGISYVILDHGVSDHNLSGSSSSYLVFMSLFSVSTGAETITNKI